jgi:plastocyanin
MCVCFLPLCQSDATAPTLTSENAEDQGRYRLRSTEARLLQSALPETAQPGHPVRKPTPRSASSPMMFAVAHSRPGSPRVARHLAVLAVLALVAAVIGAALMLASPGRASAQAKNAEVDGTAVNKWEPGNVTVPVGGTVTFKIAGGPPHPVKSGTPPSGDTSFDTSKCQIPQMGKVGDSCKVTFTKAGSFPFFCEVHYALGMTGTITVGSGGGGGSAGPTTTAGGSGTPVVSAPSAASSTQPPKPGVYWLGYGLLGGGALLALAAIIGYLRFYPGFRRQR